MGTRGTEAGKKSPSFSSDLALRLKKLLVQQPGLPLEKSNLCLEVYTRFELDKTC